MGYLTSSDSSFLRSFDGSYLASFDTTFLTLTAPNPVGTISVAYSSSLTANGTGPYTSSVIEGALPTGLSITALAITGTPTVLGSFTFTLQIFDNLGATQIEEYNITITSAAVAGSGVYRIIPGQTHEVLYVDVTIPTTANSAIPNPFIETALLGEDSG